MSRPSRDRDPAERRMPIGFDRGVKLGEIRTKAHCPVCQAEIPFDLIQGPARCDHSGGAVVSPLV